MVKHDKVVELKSPTAPLSVVFSHPKYIPANDQDDIPFQLVVIQHSDKKPHVLEDFRGSTRALVPWLASENRWSPDGRYLVMIRLESVSNHDYRHQFLAIYDFENSSFVNFRTTDGKFTTIANFAGWVAGEPHAVRIVLGVRKEGKALPPE